MHIILYLLLFRLKTFENNLKMYRYLVFENELSCEIGVKPGGYVVFVLIKVPFSLLILNLKAWYI